MFLFAENTVILKNGTNLKGKVVKQDGQNLTVRLLDGTTQTIVKTQILKVIYKDLSEKEAEKIRIAEEKKLKAKEEAERLKKERAEKIAAEAEKKRLAEEEKKALALAKIEELKEKERLAKLQKEQKNNQQTEEEWLVYRENNKVKSEATVACGSRLGLIWRSAIIPGWGQWCGGYRISAGFFFASIAGAAYYAQGPLKTKVYNDKENYEMISLINQYNGPSTRLSPEFISNTTELTTLLLENSIITDLVGKAKDDSKLSNGIYHGSLGAIGILYLSNVIHAYWIGREEYPERPIAINGKEYRPGFDWEAGMDTNHNQYFLRSYNRQTSAHAEFRYSILF